MKITGYVTCNIEAITLPGDIRARMKTERVAQLAASTEAIGLLHAPIVRKSDYKLLAGADRIASQLLLKHQTVMVELVECTDDEAEQIRLHENVHRRHDVDEQRAQLEQIIARRTADVLTENAPEEPKVRGRGRPKLPKTEARERVAKEMGVTPQALRRALEAAKMKAAAPTGEVAPPPVPSIETYGMELGPEWLAEVEDIQQRVEGVDYRIREALKQLTGLQGAKLPIRADALARAYDSLQGAAMQVRAMRPESLCPYCKGVSGIQENCAGCVTYGWVGKQQLEATPAELKRVENPVVVMGGKSYLLSELTGVYVTAPSMAEEDVLRMSVGGDPFDLLEEP